MFDPIDTEYKFNQIVKNKLSVVEPVKFVIEEEMSIRTKKAFQQCYQQK